MFLLAPGTRCVVTLYLESAFISRLAVPVSEKQYVSPKLALPAFDWAIKVAVLPPWVSLIVKSPVKEKGLGRTEGFIWAGKEAERC